MIKKNDVRNLFKSFMYAFKGIAFCINNERNMRIHISVTVLVSIFSYIYRLDSRDFLFLIICIGFVICSEMVNTAIETIVNLKSPSYNSLAKIAKDVAAGAVAVSAMVAVVAGIVLFCLDITKLIYTLKLIFYTPIYFTTLAVVLMISILFIFNGPRLFGDKKTKIYHIKGK